MLIKTIKVSDKGQISIPTKLRKSLDIKKGDELILIENKGQIIIEKPTKILKNFEDSFKDIIKISEQSLKSVWDNKDDEIWNSHL